MFDLNEFNELLYYLQQEANETPQQASDAEHAFKIYRGLVNVRPPGLLPGKYLKIQDDFLSCYNADNVTDFKELSPVQSNEQLFLYQGDITKLRVDGIVNAANSDLLGCFIKHHNCIDNVIHTKAGIQLRAECKEIMYKQGKKEAVGRVKVTNAYNLPSKYVLHTVGPYIRGSKPSNMQRDLLKQCYLSVLRAADELNIQSLAFCSISTGVFRFPKKEAAHIAVQTVLEYLRESNSKLNVIFNVFSDDDYFIYDELLNEGEHNDYLE